MDINKYINTLGKQAYAASRLMASISSEMKEKFIVNQANHNLFTNSPDQELIFKKINSHFSQFRRN